MEDRKSLLFGFLMTGAVALSTGSHAQSEEKIRFYGSEIAVDVLGGLDVTETIEVVAAGQEIRHGIYRQIPTRYKGTLGQFVVVDFEVTGVTRDGQTEIYHIDDKVNGQIIYIGDPDLELSPGTYRYTISYRVSRMIGFFDSFDELYWNVTGTGWKFAIDSVYAHVTLPPAATIASSQLSAYGGSRGANDCRCTTHEISDHEVVFSTASPLGEYQGLTIAVPFAKGVVVEPTNEQKLRWFIRDNQAILYSVGGLLLALLYYFVAWVAVGRDPKGRIRVARFEPPGLAPYELRYIKRMRYDRKNFVAAIVYMAQQGYLSIVEKGDGDYAMIKGNINAAKLQPVEQKMIDEIFGDETEKEVSSSTYNRKLDDADDILRAHLKSIRPQYFWPNGGWMTPGILICIAAFSWAGTRLPGERSFLSIFMTVFALGWSFGIYKIFETIVSFYRQKNYWRVVFMSFFALLFLAGELLALALFVGSFGAIPAVAIVLMVTFTTLFFYLLKAPTANGRALMDDIQDFELFLLTAEVPRMAQLTTKIQMDMQLFGKYLPYAIALDLQTAWSSHFSDMATAPTSTHSSWYRSSTHRSLGSWGHSIESSFGTTLASASTSSSGSGGGGSSGGGGGGGGGGGW